MEISGDSYNVNVANSIGVAIGPGATAIVLQNTPPLVPPPVIEILEILKRTGTEFDHPPDKIGDIHLIRPEADQIVDWLNETPVADHRVAMVLDRAGGGKTALIRDIRAHLHSINRPVLTIKADALSGMSTLTQLDQWLGFPVDSEKCLRSMPTSMPVLVLVDQIDALSLEMSRDASTLNLVLTFLQKLRQIDNLRILVTCREFDRRSDPRLSGLAVDREFTLQPLNDHQIQQVLLQFNCRLSSLLPSHRELLRTPLNLSLYARLLPDANPTAPEAYHSLQELYLQLWRSRIESPATVEIPTKELVSTIYAMVDAMKARNETRLPEGVLDNHISAIHYLERIGFVRREGHGLRFEHQTLLDYCFARRFVASGQSISMLVLAGDQSLFVRPNVIQVLAHLRGTDAKKYVLELSKLLSSRSLRPHLRSLLFNWLGQVPSPLEDEKGLVRQVLRNKDLERPLLYALAANSNWYEFLCMSYFPLALRQADETDPQQPALRAIAIGIRHTPERSCYLLARYLNRSEDWDLRISECMLHSEHWGSQAAETIALSLSSSPRFDKYFEMLVDHIADSHPRIACQVAHRLLDHRLSEVMAAGSRDTSDLYFLFSDSRHRSIIEALKKATLSSPADVVTELLPWFLDVCNASKPVNSPADAFFSDPVFGGEWSDTPVGVAESLALQLAQALGATFAKDPNAFSTAMASLASSQAMSAHRVLASALSIDPIAHSTEAHDYFLLEDNRLELGERYFEPCYLLGSIFPFLDTTKRRTIENRLLGLTTEWERNHRREMGRTRLRYLVHIDPTHLSPQARRSLAELQRKYPHITKHPRPQLSFGTVGSPIPREKLPRLNNSDWLSAMRKYDDSTEAGSRSRDPLKGGVSQLARELEGLASTQPQRFYSLFMKIPHDISRQYVVAVISGLSVSTAPSHLLFQLTERHLKRLAGADLRQAIWALEKRQRDGIPDNLLDQLEFISRNDPDPAVSREMNANDASGEGDRPSSDVFLYGLNSNRGAAVLVACAGAWHNKQPQFERMTRILEHAINDKALSVRACAVERLRLLVPSNMKITWDLFVRALADATDLLDSQSTRDFLHDTYLEWHELAWPYIKKMGSRQVAASIEYSSVLTCLTAFSVKSAEARERKMFHGNELQRRGAALVYSQNIANADCEIKCVARLEALIIDEHETVRKAASTCFTHAQSHQLPIMKRLIKLAITRRAVRQSCQSLVDFLVPLAAQETALALQVTASIIRSIQKGYIHSTEAFAPLNGDIAQLPLVVYAHSRSKKQKAQAMRLFEQLLDLGSWTAHKALEEFDHR